MSCLNHVDDFFLGDDANGLVADLTVHQNDERRDAHDAEFGGKLRLFVDVYLADLDVGSLIRDFVDDRFGGKAWGLAELTRLGHSVPTGFVVTGVLPRPTP